MRLVFITGASGMMLSLVTDEKQHAVLLTTGAAEDNLYPAATIDKAAGYPERPWQH